MGLGKRSPRVLQIRDRHHRDDASHQLDPNDLEYARGESKRPVMQPFVDLHDSALDVSSALQANFVPQSRVHPIWGGECEAVVQFENWRPLSG